MRVDSQQGRLIINRGRLIFRDETHWRRDGFIMVGTMGGELTVVADGEAVWTHDHLIGVVTKEKLSPRFSLSFYYSKISADTADSPLKVLGVTVFDETARGKIRVFEIEGTWPQSSPSETDPDQPVRSKLWVGVDDALPYRVTTYNSEGKEISVELYDSHELRPDPDDDLFVFKVPKNAKVVDLTTGSQDKRLIEIPVRLQGKQPSENEIR